MIESLKGLDLPIFGEWNGAIYLIPALHEIYEMLQNASVKINRDGLKAVDGIYNSSYCNSGVVNFSQEMTDYGIMGFSCILLIILSFLVKRVSYKTLVCGGRPGLLLPMGMLDSHEKIIEFTLAFLSVSEDIYTVVLGFKSEFKIQLPIMKFFIKIAVVIVLSISSYLTFAGLHNRYLLGYLFGATMSALYTYGDISTSFTFVKCLSETKIIPFLFTVALYSSIDITLFGIFLFRIIKHIRHYGFQMMTDKPVLLKERHFCDRYVNLVFTTKGSHSNGNSEEEVFIEPTLRMLRCNELKERITEKVYKEIPGFSIPPRLIIGISVGSFFAIRIFIDQIYGITPTWWKFTNSIIERYKTTHTDLRSSFEIITGNVTKYSYDDYRNAYMYLSLFYIHLFIGCCMAAIVIGFVNSLVQSFLILRNYRLNFHRLTQRGFPSMITLERAPKPYGLILGFVKFSGYQAAHILWGILVVFISLTVLLYLLIGLFLLPLFYVSDSWPRRILINYGPVLLASLILNFVQTLIVKRFFVMENGELMEINNRRSFIIFCHCLFFLNAMMGLFTSIKRIIVWAFSGIFCFCRIDFSSLPEYLQGCDSGYMCYVGFLYTEQYHHNPILRCFVNILLDSRKPQQINDGNQSDDSENMKKQLEMAETKNSKRRNKWRVAYTLIKNQSLLANRKGFLKNTIL